MSPKTKRILGAATVILSTSLGALALIGVRPRQLVGAPDKQAAQSPNFQSPQARSSKRKGPGPRNLALQPEAFKMGRQLGQRFSGRERSVVVGTLTIGAERRTVQTIRAQTEEGEQVEIKIAGKQDSLTWDREQGARSASNRAAGGDRELIERLVLDSPDQFVLAQLRGAGYYTVARNARPADAGDNYTGPLWNIVNVNDPEADEAKGPQSRSRLYYINVTTGLIDKIESESQGQPISAQIIWTEVQGEKVPAQINWIRQGQSVMEYKLSNFSHGEKEEAR